MKADFVKIICLGVLALVLQGCFVSTEPVLQPKDADYPFKTLTFEAENKAVTLSRKGDVYRNEEDDDSPDYLFKKIKNGLYIGQAAGKDKKGRPETLYALVRITPENIELILPTCSDAIEADLKAAGIEKQDKWFIDQCKIESLEQMKSLEKQIRGKDNKTQILKIKNITK